VPQGRLHFFGNISMQTLVLNPMPPTAGMAAAFFGNVFKSFFLQVMVIKVRPGEPMAPHHSCVPDPVHTTGLLAVCVD